MRNHTALPGSIALAARNAAMLSVVPVQTRQSFGKPVNTISCVSLVNCIKNDHEQKMPYIMTFYFTISILFSAF